MSMREAQRGHWYRDEPFDPVEDERRLTPEQERFYMASQWRLMWWKFRRHPIAVASAESPSLPCRSRRRA